MIQYTVRCRRCNSMWVCWNWVRNDDSWSHECWNCADCWSTPDKVRNGIPHFILRLFGRFFVDNELYERNLTDDLDQMSMDAWPDDDWSDDEEK